MEKSGGQGNQERPERCIWRQGRDRVWDSDLLIVFSDNGLWKIKMKNEAELRCLCLLLSSLSFSYICCRSIKALRILTAL